MHLKSRNARRALTMLSPLTSFLFKLQLRFLNFTYIIYAALYADDVARAKVSVLYRSLSRKFPVKDKSRQDAFHQFHENGDEYTH